MQLLLGFSPVPAETTEDLSGCPEPAQGVHSWILSPAGRTSAHALLQGLCPAGGRLKTETAPAAGACRHIAPLLRGPELKQETGGLDL